MAFAEEARTPKALIERDGALHRATLGLADRYFHDGAGFVAINEASEADGLDGYSGNFSRASHRLRVGDTGGRRWYPRRSAPGEWVEFGRPEFWTGSAWQNLNLGSPTRPTPQRYFWDRPQFSLDILFTWRRAKLTIVLKSASAARQVRWPISLNGLTRVGRTVVSIADGTTVGRVNDFWGTDANGVTVPITTSISGGFVEFTANATGLTFPLTIDPTFTSQPDATAGIDCMAFQPNATTNYETFATMWLLDYTADSQRGRGLIKFDLSTLSGATVSSATLSLFHAEVVPNNDTIHARRVLAASTWTEAGATWNLRDGSNAWAGAAGCTTSGTDYSSTVGGSVAVTGAEASGTQRDISFATAEMEAMIAANHGFVVWAAGNSGSFDYQRMHSSDGATAGLRPQLEVVYTVGGGAVKDMIGGGFIPFAR
jgi:hypothetical protein